MVQLNISRGGVPKLPIPEARVTPLGIEGDEHAFPDIHGGPRKALLVITSEGIAELVAAGFNVFPGALGENVTTRGLDRRQMRIGQRYRIGDVIIETTTLRMPCNTISKYGMGIQSAVYDEQVKSGDPSSPRWGLSGFYTAVLIPGVIRPGDAITLLEEMA